MAINYVTWDMDQEPEGNVRHIAEHGLTKDDVEQVLFGVHELSTSRSSRRPIALGFNAVGQYICVVFEWIEEDRVYPVTAYVLDE
jgi:uncharacterized DUF497 family protein